MPKTVPSQGRSSVVFFDGVCNLCNGAVRFIIRRDPKARFRFAPLQSAAAAEMIGPDAAQRYGDSIVLVEGGERFTQSTAALRIARGLNFPWSLGYGFILIPRPLRDWLYRVVARNRYRWFGRREQCMMPTPELRERFLENSVR